MEQLWHVPAHVNKIIKLIFDSFVSIIYVKINWEFPNKNHMCYKGEKYHQ